MKTIMHKAAMETLRLTLLGTVMCQKVWKDWWLERVYWERVYDKPPSFEVELTFSDKPWVIINSAGETIDMRSKASAADRLEMIRLGLFPKEFVGGGT